MNINETISDHTLRFKFFAFPMSLHDMLVGSVWSIVFFGNFLQSNRFWTNLNHNGDKPPAK